MAIVHVNRELLTDIVSSLVTYHEVVKDTCCARGICPVAQRVARIQGVMQRDEQWTNLLLNSSESAT